MRMVDTSSEGCSSPSCFLPIRRIAANNKHIYHKRAKHQQKHKYASFSKRNCL